MRKTVPLVLYRDGARIEIGTADVDLETGLMTAMISDSAREHIPDVASIIIKGTLGEGTVLVDGVEATKSSEESNDG
jgi:hypothetical protein